MYLIILVNMQLIADIDYYGLLEVVQRMIRKFSTPGGTCMLRITVDQMKTEDTELWTSNCILYEDDYHYEEVLIRFVLKSFSFQLPTI